MAWLESESARRQTYEQLQHEYNQAVNDITDLMESSFLTDEEGRTALSRLQASFEVVTRRYEQYTPMSRLPVAPLPPMLDRRNIRGIVAFRQWSCRLDGIGKLSPLVWGQLEAWKSIMYSDRIPAPNNHNGLYARALLPSLAMTNYSISLNTDSQAFGFVELLGHMEEHTDGVIRAECARMLSLYITVHDEVHHSIIAMVLLDRLQDSYFPVSIYPVTMYQAQLILMREIIINCGVQTY